MSASALLVAAPLAIGLLYYVGASVLARRPDLREMVPDDAIAVWRFKDMDAYDALRTPPPDATGVPIASASLVLGTQVNLPRLQNVDAHLTGIPGIDRSRPILEITLDPSRHANILYHVLPVDDAAAVRRRFADPNLPERHAVYVDVHGAWAAAGGDALTVRRAGRGAGLFAADRGEDWSVIVDWRKFVDANLRPEFIAGEAVTAALTALGLGPRSIVISPTPEGSVVDILADRQGRLPIVRAAWATIALYGFKDGIRAELRPTAGALSAALSRAAAETPSRLDLLQYPRGDATVAHLAVRGRAARRAVALALRDAGVAWYEAASKDDFAALRLDAPGGILLWAIADPGAGSSWTLGIVAPSAAMPDFTAFALPEAKPGTPGALPAGSAPMTMPYGGTSPAGEVVAKDLEGHGYDEKERVVCLGAGAAAAAERYAGLEASQSSNVAVGGRATPGVRELASFRLSYATAQRLLGKAIRQNGLLAPLGGGDIEGTLSTDGDLLILEAHRVAAPN